MKKKIAILISLLFVVSMCFAASVVNYSEQGGARWVVGGSLDMVGSGAFGFEGTTEDAYELTLASADPTADRTVTLPDYTGGVPLVIAQGFTETALLDTTAVDITGSSLTVADGWFSAGKALKWTMTGTKTNANGTLILTLHVDGAAICTLTSGGNTAGDWQAEFILFEHTDFANQTMTGRLIAADGSITDYAVDTTDFNDGGATIVKCQVDLGHTDDETTVNVVVIDHWVK